MKKRNFLLPSLLALAAFQGVSYAALLEIGVNFTGRNGPGNLPLGVDESAGFIPQADWNNLGNNLAGEPSGNFQDPAFNLTSGPLFTNDGLAGSRGTTPLPITLTLVTNDSWNSDGGSGTNNERLMKGLVKCSTGNTLTLTLNGLDPTKNYDFLAYTNVNNAGSQGNLTLAGVSTFATYFVQEDNGFDGTFTIGDSTNAGARSIDSDYSIWNSVTPNASGNLTLTIQHVTGGDGFGLSGFQLRELAPQIVGEAYWNFGAGTGTWDTTTLNWRGTNDAGASNATFATNNATTFGNLGTAGLRTVDIAPGGVSPGATVVNNAIGNDYVIQGGPILGAGTFTKDGPGSLTLVGVNEFSGTVALKHGTLNVTAIGDPGTAGNLGRGATISIGDVGTDDAMLDYSGPTFTVSRSLIMNDNGGVMSVSTAGVVLTMSNLSGSGHLTKTGAGDLVFTGNESTHSGSIAVDAGNLTVQTIGSGAGKNLALNGGTSFNVTAPRIQTDGRGLDLLGNASIGVTNSVGSYALTGPLNSTNVLTKTGSGRLELAGDVTLTQLPVITAGTLAITKEGAGAVNLPNGGINLGAGQRLEVAPGALDAANPVTLNGGALRVGHQGLQAFYFTGGYNQQDWLNQMNGTAFGVASSHAALTGTVVSARTITGGQADLNFTNNNYSDASAPFASQGVGDFDNIRAVFTGKIRIDSAGDTTFFTTSDDGTSIFIDGRRVVMNNQFQGPVTRQGTINLQPGLHDFLMYFYEGGGGAGVLAEYTPAGGTRQVIPNSILLSGDTVDYEATPIIVTAASTIESGAALAKLGALTLPANTLLTVNGSAAFTGTTLTGGNTHQVAVTGFNSNTSLGVLSGPTSITKTGDGGLVFTTAPQLTTTLTVNEGTLVNMGTNVTANPLAGIPITFADNTALGVSSTEGDKTYDTPIPTGINFTIAAGAFSNGNITTLTQVTIAPASIVTAAGTTLSLRSNNHNFTLAVTPQITGPGNVVTEEGPVILNGGVNNVGGNFTNRIGNVTVNGNVSTNALLQEGNFQNHGNGLIAGSIVPGSTTINGNLSATSVTNTRGTLTVNGITTNTGPLTLNGNGTTNLAASSHTMAELSGSAILNAVGAFASPGALSLSGGSTASLNSLASVSNVALGGGSSLVVRGNLDATGGINALSASNVRFDAGAGNTAAYTGGNVSLNNRSTLSVSSGIADLSTVDIQVAPLDAELFLDSLGIRHISRPGNVIAVDPRNAATANNMFNGTTNPPVSVTNSKSLSGALNIGDDNAFINLFGGLEGGGGNVDVDIFSAAFYGRYRPTDSGSVEFSTLISDDQGAIWLDFNQNGVFEDAERVVNVDGFTTNTVTGTTPFLTAGQYYNVLFGVQDTGGGSALHVHLRRPTDGASSTLNTLTPPSGTFSYFSDNGAGGNLQVDSDGTLITKSFNGVTNLGLGGGATLRLTNKGAATASSADSLRASGFNANVFLGANNTLTVGQILIPGGGTLTLDNEVGALSSGRVVVTGNVSTITMDSEIGAGILNVVGGTQLIANSTFTGATGSINAQLSGVIGGTGTLLTAVNISENGTLAPGDPSVNSGLGKLTVGNLSIADSNFDVGLRNNGLNQFDQLSVVGSISLDDAVLLLSLDLAFAAAPNDVFALILNDGADTVTGQFTTGTAITVGIHQFTIDYTANLDGGGIGNDVALTYLVPEPGAAAMLLGGFGMLIGFGRARRRL